MAMGGYRNPKEWTCGFRRELRPARDCAWPVKATPEEMARPPGDLYITVRVEPHPFFHREGDDIQIQVPITVSEAGLGAKIEVPTIDGRALLKVPQGTQNSQKFRLREKGVMNTRKNKRGDEIVEVVIQAPKVQDERTKELLRELSQVDTEDPRTADWGRFDGRWREEYGMKRSKAAYMISAVAEQYQIHPQTLRLYEREGLLAPSRSDGNTRLYTDERSGAAGSNSSTDPRAGRKSGGGRNHPEHAREDGRDAEADRRFRRDPQPGAEHARAPHGG